MWSLSACTLADSSIEVDLLMVDTTDVGSRMPHLMSDKSRVVLGSVKFCTPIGWLGRLDKTSDKGEEESPLKS